MLEPKAWSLPPGVHREVQETGTWINPSWVSEPETETCGEVARKERRASCTEF